VSHLLVTNDFPPKVGGIQSYLWELWRRLPNESFAVLTTDHPEASGFDRQQPYRIERVDTAMLAPTPALARRIRALATEIGANLVVLDPALPVGLVGPWLKLPYAVVLHGAEVTVYGRLPGTRTALATVLSRAVLVVAAGGYPATEGRRVAGGSLPPTIEMPPGVDHHRFRPLPPAQRRAARDRFAIPRDACLVLSVSRLVPRKGMDTLIEAVARLSPDHPELSLVIAGDGRDRLRLERKIATSGAPARLLGSVGAEELPLLYGCSDVFAMLCRTRWGGLEQEGFGVVFLEAAAAGVAQLAGSSGGSAEAVLDGQTGLVVPRPRHGQEVLGALTRLVDNPTLRAQLGGAARARAIAEFDYDRLSMRLGEALEGAVPKRLRGHPPPLATLPRGGVTGLSPARQRKGNKWPRMPPNV